MKKEDLEKQLSELLVSFTSSNLEELFLTIKEMNLSIKRIDRLKLVSDETHSDTKKTTSPYTERLFSILQKLYIFNIEGKDEIDSLDDLNELGDRLEKLCKLINNPMPSELSVPLAYLDKPISDTSYWHEKQIPPQWMSLHIQNRILYESLQNLEIKHVTYNSKPLSEEDISNQMTLKWTVDGTNILRPPYTPYSESLKYANMHDVFHAKMYPEYTDDITDEITYNQYLQKEPILILRWVIETYCKKSKLMQTAHNLSLSHEFENSSKIIRTIIYNLIRLKKQDPTTGRWQDNPKYIPIYPLIVLDDSRERDTLAGREVQGSNNMSQFMHEFYVTESGDLRLPRHVSNYNTETSWQKESTFKVLNSEKSCLQVLHMAIVPKSTSSISILTESQLRNDIIKNLDPIK